MTFLRRPQSVWLRRALFQVHLWTGIAVAIYVVLIGLTGAALVFRPEMQAAAFPRFFEVAGTTGTDAAPRVIIQNLRNRYPGHKLLGIDFPTYRRATYLSYLTKDAELLTVFSHPVSGEVIGELPKRSWITMLQSLHFDLLAGPKGRVVNGFGAFSLVVMFITGLVIWWPGIDRWRRSVWVNFNKGWKSANWQLHSAAGFWLFGLLMLWAVTGVEFAFPSQFKAAVNAVSALTVTRPPESTPVPSGSSPAADPSVLVEHARAIVPGAMTARVVLPTNDRAPVLIVMAREVHGDFDTSDEALLYFDQYTGGFLGLREPYKEAHTTGDLFMRWIGPLHVGSFGGVTTKILWAFLALSFPVLAITGVLVWWNRVVRPR